MPSSATTTMCDLCQPGGVTCSCPATHLGRLQYGKFEDLGVSRFWKLLQGFDDHARRVFGEDRLSGLLSHVPPGNGQAYIRQLRAKSAYQLIICTLV